MRDALLLHTVTHLRCLARNRIFHGFLLLVLVGLALALVPGLAFDDDSNRFQTLRQLARTLHGTTSLVTAGIGLFLLWTHRRARAVKMVATTPAPFAAWVASLFLTSALVGAAAHAISAVVILALSLLWNVTYQYGFVYLALDQFAESLIPLAVATLLGVALHPVIVVVLVTLINDTTVLALRQGLELLPAGPLLRAVKLGAAGLYYVLPTFDPFGERTAALLRTMRVAQSDWRYLGGTFGYAALVMACAGASMLAALRRRPGT